MSSLRLRDLVVAERIRLLSLRSTQLFLACSVLIAVASACLLSAKTNIRPEYRASFPTLIEVFNAGVGSLLMVAAACFGATTMTSEFASGLVRTTFTAVPARGRVVLAKAVALAAVTVVAGAVAAAAAVLAGQVILSPGHYPPPLSQPGGVRAAMAFTLLMPAGAVTGLGFGAALRRPVTAVVAVVAGLALLTAVTGPAVRGLTTPGAWSVLAGQQDPGRPASAALSWLVLCGWPVVSLAIGAVLLGRRDL